MDGYQWTEHSSQTFSRELWSQVMFSYYFLIFRSTIWSRKSVKNNIGVITKNIIESNEIIDSLVFFWELIIHQQTLVKTIIEQKCRRGY